MLGRIIPVLGLPGELAEHIFCTGIVGIDLELLLKFFLGIVSGRSGITPGEQQSSNRK
jgi:hypothetical protein